MTAPSRGARFMFHEEVASRAKRQRCDRGVGAEKPLGVRMVRDAVVPGRVVVHEAEVVRSAVRYRFDELAQARRGTVGSGVEGARIWFWGRGFVLAC